MFIRGGRMSVGLCMLTATQSHAGRGGEESKAASRTLDFDRAEQSGFEAALLPRIDVIGLLLLAPHGHPMQQPRQRQPYWLPAVSYGFVCDLGGARSVTAPFLFKTPESSQTLRVGRFLEQGMMVSFRIIFGLPRLLAFGNPIDKEQAPRARTAPRLQAFRRGLAPPSRNGSGGQTLSSASISMPASITDGSTNAPSCSLT